jgi:hypothetical protein
MYDPPEYHELSIVHCQLSIVFPVPALVRKSALMVLTVRENRALVTMPGIKMTSDSNLKPRPTAAIVRGDPSRPTGDPARLS